MISRLRIFFIVIIPAMIANSCKTDFEVIAPYKETMVIYGLLNVSDTMQWIRVNKAFLGEGNALVMAQNPDSINYPDILDVKLEEYNAVNSLLRTLILQRETGIIKEEGVFANNPNVIYRTNDIDRIVASNKYKLVVYNRQSGQTATALEPVVDSISINSPLSGPSQVNWVSTFPVTVRWAGNEEGVLYQLVIRFNYSEENIQSGNIVNKYLDWQFPEIDAASNQISNISLEIEGTRFYEFVAVQLDPDPSVIRHAETLDFNITVAGEEFNTYIQVNHPPTGVNQSIPLYTNIDGGIGIFSSRLNQGVKGKTMNSASVDSLNFGSITGHLGFQ